MFPTFMVYPFLSCLCGLFALFFSLQLGALPCNIVSGLL